jgi:hypothetical protein
MSRRVESVLVIKQKIVILLKVDSTIAKIVLVAIRIRYSEPKLNQQSGNIVKGIPRDWSKGIHSLNKVPKPNPPRCTYCHQIGH